jgi:pyruvate formate lyase activating enzyme
LRKKCSQCLSCAEICPNKAISVSEYGHPITDRESCDVCGKCVEVCKYGARKIIGQSDSIDSLLEEVQKDRPFYETSGGGISVSGGEPLMQHQFVLEFFKKCRECFLNTAIETCGHVKWEYLEEILEYVDLLYFDLKHMDPPKHEEFTGVSNELILGNLQRLLSEKRKATLVVRIPVIPGYNDSEENIRSSGRFLQAFAYDGLTVELLPYHRLGSSKYGQYGLDYKLDDAEPPTPEHMQSIKRIIEDYDLKCEVPA